MVIRKSTTHVYYPMPDKGSDLIGGSGRVRYVHGFLVLSPRRCGAVIGARGRLESQHFRE